MKMALTSKGLYKIATGEETKPTEAHESTKWVQRDARAQFIIANALDNKIINTIMICDSAKEVLDKLDTNHAQKTALNKHLILQKFYEIKMGENDTKSEYRSNIRNIAEQLKDLSVPRSDEDIMCKIILGLPTKYNSFTTAWDSETTKTLDNLETRLLKEETLYNNRNEDTSDNQPLFAKPNRLNQAKNNNRTSKSKKPSFVITATNPDTGGRNVEKGNGTTTEGVTRTKTRNRSPPIKRMLHSQQRRMLHHLKVKAYGLVTQARRHTCVSEGSISLSSNQYHMTTQSR